MAKEDWRVIVASSLDWEQAHAKLESAVKGLAPPLRGERPAGYPHSAWELLEHIRITQRDLLEFCQNPEYEEKLAWASRLLAADPGASGAGCVGQKYADYRFRDRRRWPNHDRVEYRTDREDSARNGGRHIFARSWSPSTTPRTTSGRSFVRSSPRVAGHLNPG